MRLKFFFFTISWKNQFIQIKDLFYHSFRLNAAELLILYKRMIALDPKIVNLFWSPFLESTTKLLPNVVKQIKSFSCKTNNIVDKVLR